MSLEDLRIRERFAMTSTGAWRSFFSALAGSGPVIVTIEDIHWADPALLDLAGGRGRPERGAAVVPLSGAARAHGPPPRLGRRAMEPFELAARAAVHERFIGAPPICSWRAVPLSSDLRAQILERAGGNPFFLEEIVQRLLDEPRERRGPRDPRRTFKVSSRRGSIA